jgi:hypothetical protein
VVLHPLLDAIIHIRAQWMVFRLTGSPDATEYVQQPHPLDRGKHLGDPSAKRLIQTNRAERFSCAVDVHENEVVALIHRLVDRDPIGHVVNQLAQVLSGFP